MLQTVSSPSYDPEEKRKIIGGEFIRVFEEEARKLTVSTSWDKVPSSWKTWLTRKSARLSAVYPCL